MEFLNILTIVLGFAFLIGIGIKWLAVVFETLSFPLYITLFAFEAMVIKWKENTTQVNKKFYRLDLPQNNNVKLTMDLFASIPVITFALTVGIKVARLFNHPEKMSEFFISATNGTLLPKMALFSIYFPIIIIYFISWRSSAFSKSPIEKIETLNIPSPWKDLYAVVIKK